jgi:membrane-associated PAP2 superfamily phosphatase
LFLAALLALGPGLAVNGVLKPYWSRPRPKEIKAFGGTQEYISVWQRGPLGVGKSFPSGHASMGFYLMAPAFVLYRRRPRWALAFLLLGLAGGAVIGLGRVAQGQHFPSDVLWAGGLVYLSGVLLRYLFHLASPRIGRGEVDEARPVLLSIEAIRRQAASEKKDRIPVPQRRRAA